MSTITQEQQQKIADWLATHDLPSGLGTKEAACSIATINLALTGELTDRIPACMSTVIGRWIIRTQDALPHAVRNSAGWKLLLPLAAGTGHEYEAKRSALILDWMWSTVLPEIQHIAKARGFGDAWRQMCELKTAESARSARKAAADAADAAATYAATVATAAITAAITTATDVYADADVYAAADAADAAAAAAAAYAADAAATAATAATDAAAADTLMQFWQKIEPCALLAKLIEVSA